MTHLSSALTIGIIAIVNAVVDDPAVVVEKRFGLGYTLNFARPITWIILLLVLMGPLVPILVSRLR